MTTKLIGEPARFVDAGALHAFVEGVEPLPREDLLDSTLLGQLAATKVADRMREFTQWYEKYFSVLGQVGWRLDAFRLEPHKVSTRTFTVEGIVRAVLAPRLTAGELELLDTTMDLLLSLPSDDPRRVVFDGQGGSAHAINLQVGLRTAACAWTVAVVLTTRETILDPLGQRLRRRSLDGDVLTLVQQATLNEEVYATVRESVIEKLGDRRRELILRLEEA